jgi:hypothetical protein
MADRNNPDTERNAGNMNDRGGQNQQSPGRNQQGDQSAGQRGGHDKDQGLGKGQQGNRELNEGGFEKGGSERSGRGETK